MSYNTLSHDMWHFHYVIILKIHVFTLDCTGLIATDRFLTDRFPFHYQRHSERCLDFISLGMPNYYSRVLIITFHQTNISSQYTNLCEPSKMLYIFKIIFFTATFIVGEKATYKTHSWTVCIANRKLFYPDEGQSIQSKHSKPFTNYAHSCISHYDGIFILELLYYH